MQVFPSGIDTFPFSDQTFFFKVQGKINRKETQYHFSNLKTVVYKENKPTSLPLRTSVRKVNLQIREWGLDFANGIF